MNFFLRTPERWISSFVVLTMGSQAAVFELAGVLCPATGDEGAWNAGWFAVGVGLMALAALPAVLAALRARQAVKREYHGSWTALVPQLRGLFLPVVLGTIASVAGAAGIVHWHPSVVTGMVAAVLTLLGSMLAGNWAANRTPNPEFATREGVATARLALAALGVAGLTGSLAPLVMARISLCVYPEGFGGMLAALGIVPALGVVELTSAMVRGEARKRRVEVQRSALAQRTGTSE